MISLPSHTWTVHLQKQDLDLDLDLELELELDQQKVKQEEQHQEQEHHEFRVMLCSIHIQTRNILANIFKNIFFFSFLWRSFLILYGEGFIRNGSININLFEQLFWIITIAFITVAYAVFPGKMLIKGTFPDQSSIGLCLFRPIDEEISMDRLKIHGVILASSFNMIIFGIYIYCKSKRLLKTKTSLIGKFRRNAISYKESFAICITWSSFNILEVVLIYLYRYLIFSPYHTFWADHIVWVFLLEIVSLACTCLNSLRKIPSEIVFSKTTPFYVTSPLVLIPRRPPQPLTPLLLSSGRSRVTRRPPDILPSNRRMIAPVRSRGKVTKNSMGSDNAKGSQQIHKRSGQHTSALPQVE